MNGRDKTHPDKIRQTAAQSGIRKLVKKRYLQWHPDKNNGCKDYVENLQLLKESYDVFTGKEECSQHSDTSSTSAPFDSGCFLYDFFGDDEWDDSAYNQSPFDDEFFNSSIKKRFAAPTFLMSFSEAKVTGELIKLKKNLWEDEGAAPKNDAASPAKENEAPPKNDAASPAEENEAPPKKNTNASPKETD
ncbi:hypothetical protein TNCT_91641 [Trichonephila clavata]|uniref:J domain-containing protein n=1 Tax=Trichonephila clavata TaxID=2740835 RepID=A0A8X6GKC3_TRICU|nr:hypothetical protein TNCT_91641 [Trichonephila clavata]